MLRVVKRRHVISAHILDQHELLWDEAKLYGALMNFLINHPTEIDKLPDELQHIVRNTLKHRRMLRDFREAVLHQHQRCTYTLLSYTVYITHLY